MITIAILDRSPEDYVLDKLEQLSAYNHKAFTSNQFHTVENQVRFNRGPKRTKDSNPSIAGLTYADENYILFCIVVQKVDFFEKHSSQTQL